MPNIGVYISDLLQERLNREKEKGTPVNASKVFQQALTKELDRVDGTITQERLSRVAERLRDSRSPEERTRAIGARAGRHWAEEVGAWADVKAVSSWVKVRALGISAEEDEPPYDYTVSIDGQALRPREGFPCDFWDLVEEPYRHKAAHAVQFWVGFIDGTSEIHDLVKNMVEPIGADIDPDDIPF